MLSVYQCLQQQETIKIFMKKCYFKELGEKGYREISSFNFIVMPIADPKTEEDNGIASRLTPS